MNKITIQDLGFKNREEMENQIIKGMQEMKEVCLECGEIKGHANWCVKSE